MKQSKNLFILAEIPAGEEVFIAELNSQPEMCNRLREMGFCEDALIKCVDNNGSMLICQVCNSRIGINQTLARQISVSKN
ncbi:MAG: FeoA family protein [Bacteroidota bacterium]